MYNDIIAAASRRDIRILHDIAACYGGISSDLRKEIRIRLLRKIDIKDTNHDKPSSNRRVGVERNQ